MMIKSWRVRIYITGNVKDRIRRAAKGIGSALLVNISQWTTFCDSTWLLVYGKFGNFNSRACSLGSMRYIISKSEYPTSYGQKYYRQRWSTRLAFRHWRCRHRNMPVGFHFHWNDWRMVMIVPRVNIPNLTVILVNRTMILTTGVSRIWFPRQNLTNKS